MAAAEKLKEIRLGLILIDLIAKNRGPSFPRYLKDLQQGIFCVKFQIEFVHINIWTNIITQALRSNSTNENWKYVYNLIRNIITFVIYSKFAITNRRKIRITKMESKRKSLIRDWKSHEQGSAERSATKLKNRKTIGLGQWNPFYVIYFSCRASVRGRPIVSKVH